MYWLKIVLCTETKSNKSIARAWRINNLQNIFALLLVYTQVPWITTI